MTKHTAYFWTRHGDMACGLKLARDEPWGEDAPLFLEMACLSHEPPCVDPVKVPAVTKQRYEYLQRKDVE